MKYYLDKRVIAVFFLGISSGFPWTIIGSCLTLWLKEAGLSRSDIGFAALIFSVFAINFLWSPVVDRARHQWLIRATSLIGIKLDSRRTWVLLCQLLIVIGCIAMSLNAPENNAKYLILSALGIAIAAATQDIAIDAYRIDSFSSDETQSISAAAGTATAGWWTGYAGLGFIPLRLSDLGWSWPQLYLLMAVLAIVLLSISALLPTLKHSYQSQRDEVYESYKSLTAAASSQEKAKLTFTLFIPILLIFWVLIGTPGVSNHLSSNNLFHSLLLLLGFASCILAGILAGKLREAESGTTCAFAGDKLIAWVLTAIIAPLKDFFVRSGPAFAIAILSFIFLFKIGEAFLGRMSIVFYKEIGFTNTEIATYSKMLTWWLTITFALVGGWVNAKFGLVKGLMVSGLAMAGSNLMFAWMAQVGPSIPLYIATIVVDGFAAAWSIVAFVSLVSLMCSHTFSATQYALMASLGNFGRTTLSAASGALVDWLDGNWTLFFIITSIMVIPSLIILWRISDRITALSQGER